MASSFSNRFYGANIFPQVRKKLETRQAFSETSSPLDPIISNDELQSYSDFNGELDLSSRTTFARMWTAVQVVRTDVNENDEVLTSEQFDDK